MARGVALEEVEAPEVDETEEIAPEAAVEEKPAKAKKEPVRGTLPEGYVTPVGLAKVLGERGLQKDRQGNVKEKVEPQQVYSTIRNAPKDHPFPLETVLDSLGKPRQAVQVEAAVAWWTEKNERSVVRATNAAEKAAKKAAKAVEVTNSEEVTEAE